MKALIIISILGVVAMMAEVFRFKKLLLPVVVIGLSAALTTLVMDWGTDIRYFNDMVYFDNYAIAFSGLIILITLLWLVIGGEYFTGENKFSENAALILFTLTGAIAMISFSDLTMFFIGLEILSISLYVLASSDKQNLLSNEAGLKYFLMGAFATGFLLFGIALIYGACGSFNLQVIGETLAKGSVSPLFIQVGILMILIGFLFKISAVPFHFWAPDVYEGAPTLVTTFMATVVKTAAFAAFYRLFSTCFMPFFEVWGPAVAVLSALTMLVGNILAVYQKSFKRMLAYSSIAHAGYMLMAIATMNEVSAGSILLYTAAYSLGSLGAFSCLHAMGKKDGEEGIDAFNGLGKRQPLVAIFLIMTMFSLAGIPPVAGFFAKYYLFYGALTGGYTWLVLVAILSSLIGVFYYFRVIYAVLKDDTLESEGFILDAGHQFLLLFAAVMSLVIGIFPSWIQSLLL
ncbi:MAG: NADH-quinone oxidoreductase subunit N [Bacteroidetes bacterium]|nr:NADH-quinone oxidoreductase subunit N [Bacteroidota bacterium]